MTKRFTMARSRRIGSSLRIRAILAARRSAADNHLVVFVLPGEAPYSRMACVVGRRHGHAPRRNRLKRLMREAFRLTQSELPSPFDFVLMPQQTAGNTLDDFVASIRAVSRRAVSRHRAMAPPERPT